MSFLHRKKAKAATASMGDAAKQMAAATVGIRTLIGTFRLMESSMGNPECRHIVTKALADLEPVAKAAKDQSEAIDEAMRVLRALLGEVRA